MPWSIPLKSKDDTFPALKAWELACKNETGLKIGKYRTGYDGELCSNDMKAWLNSRGVLNEHSASYTSAQIGRVEHMHCILMGKARTMQIDSKCPEFLWDEFYLMATHLHTKTLTKLLNGKTPHEKWFNCEPDYMYMKEIGCCVFIFVPTHNPKVHPQSIECILIGYGANSKTYWCWDRTNNKVYQLYHVKFIERHEERSNSVASSANNPVSTLEELKNTATLKPRVNDEDARPDVEILDPDTAYDIHASTGPLHHNSHDDDHDERDKEELTLK